MSISFLIKYPNSCHKKRITRRCTRTEIPLRSIAAGELGRYFSNCKKCILLFNMIPDFQRIMLPVLQFLGDESEKNVADIRAHIASTFRVTEEEKRQKTPSGKQNLFNNRVAWSVAYLKMANLIRSERRSIYKITQNGLSLLQKKPDSISVKFLKSIPEFREKVSPNKKQDLIIDDNVIENNTPDELIEIGYNKIREELTNQLLDMIKANSPSFFESLVIDLLIKIGYGGNKIDYGEVVGKSGDEGIDGIIKEDKLGLDKIYIQAKKWGSTVGRPEIQKFVGALQGKRAKKGIFITTSTFSKEAFDYSANIDTNIVLIDGVQLAELMLDHELGVSIKETYKICKVDTDYFEE